MNKNNDCRFLPISDEKISVAIAQFENEVDFELVPVIARKSVNTNSVFWMILVLSLILFWSVSEVLIFFEKMEFSDSQVIHYNFLGLIIAGILAQLISKSMWIQRTLTIKTERDKAVENRAYQTYFEKHLFKTESHQGLLLYISFLEKRIMILPDPQNPFEGREELSKQVLTILQEEFKANNYEQGLLKAIEYLKQTLVKQFPKNTSQNNQNQLANKLIWLNE